MKRCDALPNGFSQHPSLPIRLVTPEFGHVSAEAAAQYKPSYRLTYYFFLFLLDGTTEVEVDLEKIALGQQELVFLLPHQIRHVPAAPPGSSYYKLGLPEECLSRLPKRYPFLLNPLNQPKLRFTPAAAARLRTIFELLRGLLSTLDSDPELLLVQLHSLLTEVNAAYFKMAGRPAPDRLAKYLQFKELVENSFTEQPTIKHLATALAMSPNSLYQLVRQYAGHSPKEFVTQRLILEAKRCLYYGERASVKELAFALGFNDPAYFSRLFKRITGKTVVAFVQDLSQF